MKKQIKNMSSLIYVSLMTMAVSAFIGQFELLAKDVAQAAELNVFDAPLKVEPVITSEKKYFVDELIERYNVEVEIEDGLKKQFEPMTQVKVDHLSLVERRRRMEVAMKIAAAEFDVPFRLLQGIAGAESSYGSNFYNPEDVNTHNWVGLKNPDGQMMKLRIAEGSWLRFFNNELAASRSIAKTLRLYYLDEGKVTPEQISCKWVGRCSGSWVNNVRKFYNP